ncbi:hypothetical protein K505DRAFT_322208 [Melanomma pulvis-pyrius CBS 109.77]|uniref:F-box domain-containing protein n=1 Tax=Melanomma pulvis-pyrius CBS 109.77 TaxID=1314802 RepID=A0A6A6XP00_9PLEO|nr:hypothetical protein K505DRAFT_322208 [Melanomma pulvis-pyrius CBS 109.77]
MVNHKNVTFTVNKQTPIQEPPPVAYGIVINYGKPGAKQTSTRVYRAKLKLEEDRKRNVDDLDDDEEGTSQTKKFIMGPRKSPVMAKSKRTVTYKPQLSGPTKFRKGKPLAKGIDLDCWFTILSFADPSQLLEMRSKIASCFRFLRDNPMLWKYSRCFFYGDSLPDPPADLTEFQYAHLRHGHGCMSCGTRSTRKTYWVFLRRWCKSCLHSKVVKGQDVVPMLKDYHGEDISFIQKCLPSGIFDSWGNFVGAGPSNNHSVKTIYLLSDVKKLVAEYIKESRDNYISWHAEVRTWVVNKTKMNEDRREFARRMELWEEMARTSKSYGHQENKTARKMYFADKASKLTPPISAQEMQLCPSYRRAVAIPKLPNMTSWMQLRPKLEKEAAALAAKRAEDRETARGYTKYPPLRLSTIGSSTPSQYDTDFASSSYQYPCSFPHLLGEWDFLEASNLSTPLLDDSNSVFFPH